MSSSITAVTEIPTPPQALASSGLAGSTFSDAYCGHTTRADVTALQVAAGMFAQPPRWVSALMSLRDRLVRPFGLKTGESLDTAGRHGERAGIFPVMQHSATEAVLGADDKHLDFRIWLHVEPQPVGCSVTACTVVRTHNRFGRTYLRTIMPFHRLLSRQMLSRALRQLDDTSG